MNSKQLIQKLRKAKVSKEKKWIYSLMAWALENKTVDYPKFQVRINTSFCQNKGYFDKYYEGRRKKLNSKKMKKYREEHPDKIKQYQREDARRRSIMGELFKNNKLSKKSMKTIETKFKKNRCKK